MKKLRRYNVTRNSKEIIMPFVKLDCSMVTSSLWPDKQARDLFITTLLLARPFELVQPANQLEVRSLKPTGWKVPSGWYGLAEVAGSALINTAGLPQEDGFKALERLCLPDKDSRSQSHSGRRMARIDGGYLVLNYAVYRSKDHGAAERMKRWRARKSSLRTKRYVTRNVTHSREQRAESREQKHTENTPTQVKCPKISNVEEYATEIGLPLLEAEKFYDHFQSNGWKVSGKSAMKDWRAALRNWNRRYKEWNKTKATNDVRSRQTNAGLDRASYSKRLRPL